VLCVSAACGFEAVMPACLPAPAVEVEAKPMTKDDDYCDYSMIQIRTRRTSKLHGCDLSTLSILKQEATPLS
jgi:hypothetical protein